MHNRNRIKIVDYFFFKEEEIRRKCKEYRLDPPKQRLLIKPSNRMFGNPVENIVIRNLSELNTIALDDGQMIKHPEKILLMISKTYDKSDEKVGKIARMKYNGVKSIEIQTLFNLTPTKYYRTIEKFRNLAIYIGQTLELF